VRCRSRKTLAKILTAGCPDCKGRMLIAWSGLVCENGCGRLLYMRESERKQLRRSFPHLVIECVPVSKMKLCLY
jgi:Ribonuclease G/E